MILTKYLFNFYLKIHVAVTGDIFITKSSSVVFILLHYIKNKISQTSMESMMQTSLDYSRFGVIQWCNSLFSRIMMTTQTGRCGVLLFGLIYHTAAFPHSVFLMNVLYIYDDTHTFVCIQVVCKPSCGLFSCTASPVYN